MNNINYRYYRFLPFVLVVLAGYWLSRNNPYFWDTVQFGSEHAHWYYENNFSSFLLPEMYDSGHPPLFGMYVAAWWTLFGKSLAVSHLSMLPFTFLSLILLFKIGDKLLGTKHSPFLVILCIADPVFAAQHILVSPDIIIFCGTLLTFYGILSEKKWVIGAGVLLLGSISMRGMMVACSFGVYQVGMYMYEQGGIRRTHFKNYFQFLLPYLPAIVFFGSFMWYHYEQCGWIGYHANSPWAASFERVGWTGVFRNFLVAGFRFFEFGRAAMIGMLAFLLWTKRAEWKSSFPLILLLVLLSVGLIVPQLWYRELLGTRYFMPIFLILHILFVKILSDRSLFMSAKNKLFFAVVAVILVSGNFWRYPKQFAMGWDATLSHVFYFPPREQMLRYIAAKGIPYKEIGTVFPEYGPFENIDLKGNSESMSPLDLSIQKYVYYSSVMNLKDEVLFNLFKEYEQEQAFDCMGVKVILFRKK